MNLLTIRDVIHGNIHLNELEIKVVDHDVFQRLRDISQLGFLKYIFPSANHTRFEHSIGVMHLATQMLKNIAFNQSNLLYSDQYVFSKNNAQSFNIKAFEQMEFWEEKKSFNQISIEENKKIITQLLDEKVTQCLRLAALIHDLGHGPYSHASECLTEKINFKDIIDLNLPGYIINSFEKKRKREEKIKHEWLSAIMTYYIFDDLNIEDQWLQDVLSLIDKDIEPSPDSPLLKYKIYYLLRDIISSEIDADRMDYLLRDSYYTGVKYGLFDLNRILSSLYFSINQDHCLHLAIHEDGLLSFEDYLFRRYQMYIQIYMHKTNLSLEGMLNNISHDLTNIAYPILKEEWINFNDYSFKNWLNNEIQNNIALTHIVNDIFHRKSWTILYEDISFKSDQKLFEKYIDKLHKKFKKNFHHHFYIHNLKQYMSSFHPFSDNKDTLNIKTIKRNIITKEYEFYDIKENSYLINGLSKTIEINRIYVCRHFYRDNKKEIEKFSSFVV